MQFAIVFGASIRGKCFPTMAIDSSPFYSSSRWTPMFVRLLCWFVTFSDDNQVYVDEFRSKWNHTLIMGFSSLLFNLGVFLTELSVSELTFGYCCMLLP